VEECSIGAVHSLDAFNFLTGLFFFDRVCDSLGGAILYAEIPRWSTEQRIYYTALLWCLATDPVYCFRLL
jgi:hypothetical protein